MCETGMQEKVDARVSSPFCRTPPAVLLPAECPGSRLLELRAFVGVCVCFRDAGIGESQL